ncbi:MAG: hypothetical protein ACYDBQ_10375 [Thermoplasmatota archaeon]
MPLGDMVASAAIQLAAAGVAAFGSYRCIRLQRFAGDQRLKALGWFFGLFAAAVLLQAAWQLDITGGPPRLPFPLNGSVNFTEPDFHRIPFAPEVQSGERVNVLLAGSHAFMLASLVVGVWAFGHRTPRGAAAFLPLVAVGDVVPLMLALEAGLTLYLAARALINHVERRSPGAVQVAIGFLLFFVGHLVFFLSHQPGMGRMSIGDVLALVGIVLLVQVLPGTP